MGSDRTAGRSAGRTAEDVEGADVPAADVMVLGLADKGDGETKARAKVRASAKIVQEYRHIL